MGTHQHNSQQQVRDFFKKLMLWRDESQKQFFTIVNSHSDSINEAINNLVEEVSDLQAQLSVTRKERNDLFEMMKKTRGKIQYPRENLPITQKQQEPHNEDILDLSCSEVGHPETEETGIGKHTLSSNEKTNQEESEDNGAISYVALNQQTLNDRDTENGMKYEDGEEVAGYDTARADHKKKETSGSSDRVGSNKLLVPGGVNLAEQDELNGQSEAGSEEAEAMKRDKKFKCDQCPYASHNLGHLKQHITGVHHKIKSHVCGDCSYATSQKGNLSRHREYVHNKGDKLKCNQCPFSSVRRDNLEQHISSVHGRKKNHVCSECGYAASNKKYLNQHMVSVHKIGNKKYDCRLCPMRYKGEEALRNHVNTCHKYPNWKQEI